MLIINIEIGSDLISLVDPEIGGTLLEKITETRRYFMYMYGMILPPIRITDNPKLKPIDYKIQISNKVFGEYSVELTNDNIDDGCSNHIINNLKNAIIEQYTEMIKNLE